MCLSDISFARLETNRLPPNKLTEAFPGDKLPDLASPRNIPLDVFIPNFVAKGEGKDKTILIYDQVGKQVRWLMYYLEDQGLPAAVLGRGQRLFIVLGAARQLADLVEATDGQRRVDLHRVAPVR